MAGGAPLLSSRASEARVPRGVKAGRRPDAASAKGVLRAAGPVFLAFSAFGAPLEA
jgi:hypothetical protein